MALWLHLVSVTIWVGGSIFWVTVMLPSFSRSDSRSDSRSESSSNGEKNKILEDSARRFRNFAWLAAALIIITGLLNLHVAGTHRNYQFGTTYLSLLAIKILLVGGMIAHQIIFTSIAARGLENREELEGCLGRLRRNLTGNAIIGIIVILLGSLLSGF